MKKHKRVWLACLLAVTMLLSLVPMAAFAADDAVIDEAGLRAAVAEGGEITIGADITIAEPITVDKDVTINFDNHKIALPAGMNYIAEAAFIVSGAELTLNGTASWSSGISYAGNGSLFKLVGVVGKETAVTVNGGGYTAHDNWNQGICEFPTALFIIESAADATLPSVLLKGGSFTCSREGYFADGPLVSGDASGLVITGGTYSADPQAYVDDSAMCFEQSWGGEWQVLSEDEQMSEEFRSILNDEGKFVVNRYEPNGEEDLFYLYDALMMHFWDEDEGQSFTVYDATYNTEEKTMYFSMLDLDTGAILETHNVPLTFAYDPALKAQVDKLIADLPEGEEVGGWVEPYYFAVNDLELVNYWLTCSQEVDNINLLINYSDEFKKFIGYKNFRLDARMGDGDFFYTATAGIAEFAYNGTAYGTKEFGARAEHILYVAEDATDAVAAAQKRLDDYLGEGKVTLVNCGTIVDMLLRAVYENDPIWQGVTFQEFLASPNRPQFSDIEAETGVKGLLPTDICVKTEINGVTYYMVIKKNDDKLVTPTYQNVDVNTDIVVSTDDSSVPLDTMLEVKQLTSGAEYDRIHGILEAEESETYDIKLHSGSLGEYITELDDGEFEVNIPIPEKFEGKDLNVYYVDAQGEVTTHVVTPKDGYASFITTHFSVYTLVASADNSGHGHAYADKWESDKDNHWHACSCGEKDDVAAHTFKDGKCSVCGAVADDAGKSPLTGETDGLTLPFALVLIGGALVALTARGKEKQAVK